MESIIKIQSEQGFSETWFPSDFVQNPARQKLIDLIIPGNTGTYDLGKSWINLNMEVLSAQPLVAALPGVLASDTALFNNGLALQEANATGQKMLADTASIVRNADMFSSEKGMVESIRRVDTLRQLLWNMENDKAEQRDGLDMIGQFFGRRGKKNKTSSLIQIMGGNVAVNGVADPTIKAQKISRDYRINLSDLFGVGSAMWNTDVYGDTRIHLEIEPNRLHVDQMGGFEDVTIYDPNTQNKFWGQMKDVAALAAGAQLGVDVPLVTEITYDNYQLDLPFYVGQSVNVNHKVGAAGATNSNVIISAIEFNEGTNNATPPAGTNVVRIFTRTSIHTNATAAPVAITLVLVKANLSTVATDQIRINRAEIVLTRMENATGPSEIDYTTYSTEEINGNDNINLTSQLMVEPNAQNLFMAHCNATGGTAPIIPWTSYRMAINNDDVSGNRDITYDSPLHRDRIKRTFANRAQNISNFSLRMIDNEAAQQAAANQTIAFPVFETLPLTQSTKIVNFKLKSAAAKSLVFYKELVKTI